ncbi:META domain-containing protein [Deinococcus hohokamensis]|uniref:META domain-containing protein n=1 Tax=Deinococcus hohokamensis TaxID=309883 RepID=A0ABV9I4T0_9DEIO
MLTLLAALSLLPGPVWSLTRITPAGRESFTLGPRLTPPSLTLSRLALPTGTLGVTGTTGCSPLKGRVTVRGAAVRFTVLNAGTTERCPDHALGLREDFLRLLSGATRSEVRDQTLILSGAAGELVFTRRSAGPRGP